MIRILSLFSGIGAFEKALTNLGIEYEIVNYSEVDPYVAVAYSAIHNVPLEKNLGDITKVTVSQLPTNIDIVTYGHPCQSFSLAGLQGGIEDPRGNLMYEALRVISVVQPKVAIEENVLGLLSKKFETEFHSLLEGLINIGYNNHYQIYNAADYGIAQERKRVFTVSVRKDIRIAYSPPEAKQLDTSIYDYLEDKVAAKYYISDEKMSKLLKSIAEKYGQTFVSAGGWG